MARRQRRTNDSLDERSGSILRAVIDEYVTSAVPVSSGSLVAHYPLGVSSATVRSILAELEAIGLLTTVLGFGKDAVARKYLSLACKRHVPSLDLSALFAGVTS